MQTSFAPNLKCPKKNTNKETNRPPTIRCFETHGVLTANDQLVLWGFVIGAISNDNVLSFNALSLVIMPGVASTTTSCGRGTSYGRHDG
ncbi:hypothetical protein GCM10023156_62040 [Novipirellula rosea]|uniref:Uncharacterized protein n=1 Tax=Novipirellula rosea TaxID=1031540 RepID=A0ABP8NRK0_9BACT